MLGTEQIELETAAGKKTYLLGKFPATVGREVLLKYPTANAPKVGDYDVSEATMLKVMSFVAVHVGDTTIQLETRALVDAHVVDAETLMKLEVAMFKHNYSFFGNGTGLKFLEGAAVKLLQLIPTILTNLSAQSSPAEKPLSTK